MDRSPPCRVEEQRPRGLESPSTTPDADYFIAPHRTSRRGQREIVEGWPGRANDRGDWDFRYEVLRVTDDTAYVRGWMIYEDGVVGNLWVVRFAREQRCRSFTEWWMVEDT